MFTLAALVLTLVSGIFGSQFEPTTADVLEPEIKKTQQQSNIELAEAELEMRYTALYNSLRRERRLLIDSLQIDIVPPQVLFPERKPLVPGTITEELESSVKMISLLEALLSFVPEASLLELRMMLDNNPDAPWHKKREDVVAAAVKTSTRLLGPLRLAISGIENKK